jgi:hypothetical protein
MTMEEFPTRGFAPWKWRSQEGSGHPGSNDSAGSQDVPDAGLTGYTVEATDGSIGTVEQAGYDTGDAWLVVDTGKWIFGRKVLLPAGTVQAVDRAAQKVYVDRTKDQVKDSPEYDESTFSSSEYRHRVGTYYTDLY